MARLIEQYYDKERTLLDYLYDNWPMGVEVMNVNQKTLVPELGLSATGSAMRIFEGLGILSKRLEYGKAGTPAFGRHYHYTLLVGRETALTRLEDSIDERRTAATQHAAEGNRKSSEARKGRSYGGRKPKSEPVSTSALAIARYDDENTRAIVGEDAPSSVAFRLREAGVRKPDEAAALVEAARQYTNRNSTLTSKIAELEAVAKELGMTVNTDLLTASITDAIDLEPDPVLEIVAQVLPYIEQVERNVKTLTDRLVEAMDKNRELDGLRREVRTLREQNQRLIGQRATGATTAHA